MKYEIYEDTEYDEYKLRLLVGFCDFVLNGVLGINPTIVEIRGIVLRVLGILFELSIKCKWKAVILKYSHNRGLNWNYVVGWMLVPNERLGLGYFRCISSLKHVCKWRLWVIFDYFQESKEDLCLSLTGSCCDREVKQPRYPLDSFSRLEILEVLTSLCW